MLLLPVIGGGLYCLSRVERGIPIWAALLGLALLALLLVRFMRGMAEENYRHWMWRAEATQNNETWWNGRPDAGDHRYDDWEQGGMWRWARDVERYEARHGSKPPYIPGQDEYPPRSYNPPMTRERYNQMCEGGKRKARKGLSHA